VEFLSRAGPESFWIVDGLFVQGLILFETLDVGFGAELRRRRKDTVLAKRGIDVLTGNGRNGQGRHENVLLGKKETY
jgi:hypothetical protein